MLEPGDSLQGRYTVDQILGQGGRGIVYLARQDMLGGRRVAIKETHFDFVLPEEHAEAVAQFQREARLLASLNHPNLVDVKDFFEENGNLYLVMDFVEGETLEEVLERSNGTPVDLDDVFSWADQICDVLESLHKHHPPIIFRDLKPGNIMLDKKGNVRLIDFGIARVLEPDSKDLTERAGTVGYAPYEQHAGKPPDARTDIYALGATLYDLVTGHPPPSAVAIRTGEESLELPRELNPNLPSSLETVVLKMMATKPEERFPNVGEVRKALRMAYKSANSGIVRRVSLDDSQTSRRLGPLPPTGQSPITQKKFLLNSAGGTVPSVKKPDTPPSVAPRPPLKPPVYPPDKAESEFEDDDVLTPPEPTVPAAPLPAPVAPEKPRAGFFKFLSRDPSYAGAWVVSPDKGKANVGVKSYRDGIITFQSSIPLPVKESVPFFVSMKNVKEGPFTMGCNLLREQMVDGQLEYLGRISQVPPLVDKVLQEQFPPPTTEQASAHNPRDGRRAPRIQTAFQVMSRQLPGYKALSTNISLSGIQLDVREEVPVETRLQMKLDFDDFRFNQINCEGEVKWCRPGEERDWLIGIAFISLSEEARDTIKRYIQLVAGSKSVRM